MRTVPLVAVAIAALACGGDDAAGTTGSTSSGSTGGGGSGGSAMGGGGMGGMGGSEPKPEPPAELTRYLTGNEDDADVVPTGPGLIFMGGSIEVDAAFTWWNGYLAGGDVVVLRTSGSDGYNDYLHSEIGGNDSVETLLVTSAALASDPYVAWTVRHAEGIFMAGGDQATYLTHWKGTALEDAMHEAYQRGAVLGGTSAGCAVLGEFAFAAYNDTVYSDEALADPYNTYMQLDQEFLELPLAAGIITDTHFAERDRMGRLVGFLARVVQDGWTTSALGLGVDERTALVVGPDGAGEVLGDNAVYLVQTNGAPAVCQAGEALDYAGLSYTKLTAGDTVTLPGGATGVPPMGTLTASGGALSPANPY